ncbi:MAG: hypothetical protein KDA80_06665 [Planctomycetaceae bacterium]|nr:hypothetical protein [Planctomycetaceae bacterium]
MKRSLLASLFAVLILVQTVRGNDFSNVPSGLLLGIYATPNMGGMEVTSTIPGYSAEGRLFTGDVLLRATVDGVNIRRLRTSFELENAKTEIGPNREAAIEFWRPGQGLLYAWVEFTPIASPAAPFAFGGVATQNGNSNQQFNQTPSPAKATFKLESEKPGARQMFHGGNPTTTLKPTNPGTVGTPPIAPSNPNRDPGSLFGR